MVRDSALTIDQNADGDLTGGTLAPFLQHNGLFAWLVYDFGVLTRWFLVLDDESSLQAVSSLGAHMTVVPVGPRRSFHVVFGSIELVGKSVTFPF